MTVTYSAEIASSKIGNFLRLLIRWKGSIYKLIWKEFLLFTVLYYILNLVYRFALEADSRRTFESVVLFLDQFANLISLAFVLGFYVALVYSRWWAQWESIPWPDRISLYIMSSIQGQDEKARLLRRTIMRYLNLAFVITMASISPPVKKRFPTFKHMAEAGFMSEAELQKLHSVQYKDNKYFIPMVWSAGLVTKAHRENYIKDDFAHKTLLDEINNFRGMLGNLLSYDWINIPLLYTQVVTIAVYSFFLACLLGRQLIDPATTDQMLGLHLNTTATMSTKNYDEVDTYVPIFTLLQFLFYMGWLKVAEVLTNPFGGDDTDFDINYIIDRNIKLSFVVVDEMYDDYPEMEKDQFWNKPAGGIDIPYTGATIAHKNTIPFLGSAKKIMVPAVKATFEKVGQMTEIILPDDVDQKGSVMSAQPGNKKLESEGTL